MVASWFGVVESLDPSLDSYRVLVLLGNNFRAVRKWTAPRHSQHVHERVTAGFLRKVVATSSQTATNARVCLAVKEVFLESASIRGEPFGSCVGVWVLACVCACACGMQTRGRSVIGSRQALQILLEFLEPEKTGRIRAITHLVYL